MSLVCGMRSDPSEQQEADNVTPQPPSLVYDTGNTVNTALSSQIGILPELSATYGQLTDMVPWSGPRLDIGPEEIWEFDPGLSA